MNYKQNLGSGKVAIRDVYAIIARHLPPDDPTYLESMSTAELEEMASRDVRWEIRPDGFDSLSVEEALRSRNTKLGASKAMPPIRNAPEVAM